MAGELPSGADAWRTEDGHAIGVVITEAGMAEIDIEPEPPQISTRRQLFTAADPTQRPDREVERIARLAFLAPDIVTAILEGRQVLGF